MRSHLSNRSFSPRVESLEGRLCLACTITADDNTLTIEGDDAANTVSVTHDGAGNVVVVCDGEPALNFSGIKEIEIDTAGGDDSVNLTVTGELTKKLEIELDLGDGNDTSSMLFGAIAAKLALEADLGAGNDTLSVNLDQEIKSKGQVKMDVEGGEGNDTWNLSANEVRSKAKLQAQFDGDAGDDILLMFLQDPIDAKAHVQIQASGGDGADALTVDATTVGTGASIGAGAKLHVQFDGGKGADTLDVSHDGNVAGQLQIQVNGGADNDIANVDIAANVTGKGKVHVQVNGNDGDDDLTLFLHATGSAKHVKGTIDGGAGFDTCVATPNVKKKNCEA